MRIFVLLGTMWIGYLAFEKFCLQESLAVMIGITSLLLWMQLEPFIKKVERQGLRKKIRNRAARKAKRGFLFIFLF